MQLDLFRTTTEQAAYNQGYEVGLVANLYDYLREHGNMYPFMSKEAIAWDQGLKDGTEEWQQR
jgi:hypothetical protein